LDDPRHPRFDPRYADVDPACCRPAESLKDTLARVLPYWESRIVPELRANKNVLIVAHGNSLRALVKMLDMMSESDIVEFNIPTGIPILYELDEQLQPRGRRFLGDPASHRRGARRRAPANREEITPRHARRRSRIRRDGHFEPDSASVKSTWQDKREVPS
jgi:2,3-bisphosphoglycerate-dependent phosphoglycerate mutase